jgi:hypothetical protein
VLKLSFLSRLRPRSGYDIVAVIAMCAALGTGGAYAAATIGGEEVVDESLTDADIKNGSLGPAIADQAIGPWELKPSGVWGSHILDESVTGEDVAESTLAKVPAAAAADTAQTAQKATTAGSAPIAGYNVVTASLPWNGDRMRVGNVTCPAGQKVLGGTYWMWHPDDPWTSIPADVMTKIVDNGSSFRVAVADDYLRDKQFLINNQPWGAGPWKFDIQATCAKVG